MRQNDELRNVELRKKAPLWSMILLPAFMMLFAGCQTSPTGRKQLAIVPNQQLIAMGEEGFNEIKKTTPRSEDKASNQYIQCVAESIVTVLDEKRQWEIVVFKESSANAFALPGENIGVYAGLLEVAQTSDQLATVLAHEVAHVLANHSQERVSGQLATQGGLAILGSILQDKKSKNYQLLMAALGLGAQFGVLLPHSRLQESEADVIGLRLMAQAGFNPQAAIELWQNMAKASQGQSPPEFLSTHPSHSSRVKNLQSHMAEAIKTFNASDLQPQCKNLKPQTRR